MSALITLLLLLFTFMLRLGASLSFEVPYVVVVVADDVVDKIDVNVVIDAAVV